MQNVVLAIHLILALLLIGVVLLQRSEGGGLGMGGTGGVVSGRSAATALAKVTWVFAGLFIATSITLTVLAAKDSASSSVTDQFGGTAAPAPVETAPALPATLSRVRVAQQDFRPMKRVRFNEAWPESWKYSHPYDRLEVYGELDCRGYAYAYAERRRHTLELIQRAAAPPAKLLDVAAAQGNFSLSLAELGYEVTWNDLRVDLAGYVQLKHERGLVHYAPGNAFELSFIECFDVRLFQQRRARQTHDRRAAHRFPSAQPRARRAVPSGGQSFPRHQGSSPRG